MVSNSLGNNGIGGGTGGPSLGGGGRGGRSVGSAPRMTFFQWTEATIGKIRVVTPKAGEAPREPLTDEEHVKKALGYDEAKRRGDERPVLVYFHYPHEHPRHGKLVTSVCTRTLDDEQAARWSKLFRTVQIDMGETEEKFADMIGHEDGPVFVVLDEELDVKARIPVTKSASKLTKYLEAAHKRFPEARKALRKKLAENERLFDRAKRFEKRDELEKALELIDKIRFSDVRVGPLFDRAMQYGQLLARKIERENDDD